MYLLKHNTTGNYVAKSGNTSSYTSDLSRAQKFATREEAELNRCVQSERIVALSDIIRQITGSY